MIALSVALAYLGSLAFIAFLRIYKAPPSDFAAIEGKLKDLEQKVGVLQLKAGLKG